MADLSYIRNITNTQTALPFPYRGVLKAGQVAIVTGTPATVISNLGGDDSVRGVFLVEPSKSAADVVTEHDDVGTSGLTPGSVGSTELAASCVIEAKIGTGAVTETKIGSGAVTSGKIGTSAVIEGTINSGAVTETKIGAGAVTSTKLGSGAVTSSALGSGAVVAAAIGSGAVTSPKLGIVEADGLAPTLTLRKAFTAGAGGSSDDVVIYNANAPFAFRILDVQVLIATAIALSTVTLRDTVGGAGSALSDDLSSATTGRVRDAGASVTATPSVAANGTVVLNRSDNGVAGEVILTIAKA